MCYKGKKLTSCVKKLKKNICTLGQIMQIYQITTFRNRLNIIIKYYLHF